MILHLVEVLGSATPEVQKRQQRPHAAFDNASAIPLSDKARDRNLARHCAVVVEVDELRHGRVNELGDYVCLKLMAWPAFDRRGKSSSGSRGLSERVERSCEIDNRRRGGDALARRRGQVEPLPQVSHCDRFIDVDERRGLGVSVPVDDLNLVRPQDPCSEVSLNSSNLLVAQREDCKCTRGWGRPCPCAER